MNWLIELHRVEPVAHVVRVLSFVCLYPLTTLLRILSPQVLAILFFR